MTPALLNSLVIQPVVTKLNWPQPTQRAVLLLAIAIQESDLKHRVQRPSGPAKSWWQIEPTTAIDCCARCIPVRKLCAEIGSEYEHSDLAACAIAAGILRITRGKLPNVGDRDSAWEYYLKAWRPGKPRPERWPSAYGTAITWARAASPNIGWGADDSREVPNEISADRLANPADVGWVSNT